MKRNLKKRIVILDRINDLRCVKATKYKLVAWNHRWMKKNIAFGCRCRSFAVTKTVCIRTDTCTSIARNVRVYLLESCQPFSTCRWPLTLLCFLTLGDANVARFEAHRHVAEGSGSLGCEFMSQGYWSSTFWENVVSSSTVKESFFLDLLNLGRKGITFFRNVGSHQPNDTASRLRRLKSSRDVSSPCPQEPLIRQCPEAD